MKVSHSRNLDRVAKIIRKHGSIDRVNLCMEANISMATLYNYKPFLERLFEDITYVNGMFTHHKIENRIE